MRAARRSHTERVAHVALRVLVAWGGVLTSGCASGACCPCREVVMCSPVPAQAPAPRVDASPRPPAIPVPAPPVEPSRPAPPSVPAEAVARDVVLDLGDGRRLRFDGEDLGRLGDASVAEQDATLTALRDRLAARTAAPAPRDADGSSAVKVLVRGDRTAKWKYVQWIMQACADPKVRIFKIHFEVMHAAPGGDSTR